eukprot:COSAG01_NODE_15393_length_1343_cov_1.685691_1_plen_37_part_10
MPGTRRFADGAAQCAGEDDEEEEEEEREEEVSAWPVV